MANSEKMTYAKAMKWVLDNVADMPTDVKEKVEGAMANYEKKANAEKKPTKTQVENEGIKTSILEGMETNKAYTVTDLQKSIPSIAELTNQKISALLRQMVEDGSVVKSEDKKKSYFTKAE